MKRIIVVLLALLGATLPVLASANGQVRWNVGIGVGFGNGYGHPHRPMLVAPAYYAPPRVVYIPSTVVHVDGARHLPNGKCEIWINSRWLRGVDRNGMCYVED